MVFQLVKPGLVLNVLGIECVALTFCCFLLHRQRQKRSLAFHEFKAEFLNSGSCCSCKQNSERYSTIMEVDMFSKLMLTEEERVVDPVLGYPHGYAKLCQHAAVQLQGLVTPFTAGPPQRFLPYSPQAEDVSPRFLLFCCLHQYH